MSDARPENPLGPPTPPVTTTQAEKAAKQKPDLTGHEAADLAKEAARTEDA